MFKKCINSFCISSMCGMIVNLFIEIIVRMITGWEEFNPISPAFVELFPSATIAFGVNALLYGLIGATFAGMMFIYEFHKIGFVIQNVLYYLATAIVWMPIVIVLWQLQKYPNALIGTLCGFAISYVIMSIVAYRITRNDVEQINDFLAREEIGG